MEEIYVKFNPSGTTVSVFVTSCVTVWDIAGLSPLRFMCNFQGKLLFYFLCLPLSYIA